jgi:hypothetical protein
MMYGKMIGMTEDNMGRKTYTTIENIYNIGEKQTKIKNGKVFVTRQSTLVETFMMLMTCILITKPHTMVSSS